MSNRKILNETQIAVMDELLAKLHKAYLDENTAGEKEEAARSALREAQDARRNAEMELAAFQDEVMRSAKAPRDA